MSVTMNDVRQFLDAEEVDYQAASLLGPDALPLLDELVRGDDPMLASKATYLASLIPGEGQAAILAEAASSGDATVRVAAATGLANLDEEAAAPLADGLLADADVGVRKQAVRSAGGFDSPAMAARVRQVADADPEGFLRSIAAEALRLN
jgi:HEAT repeat protein